MSHRFCSFVRIHYLNCTQIVPLTSKNPRKHPHVLWFIWEKNTWANHPGDWIYSQGHRASLRNGAATEQHQQGKAAQGLPGECPFISLHTMGPLVSEVSPWGQKSRPRGTRREAFNATHSSLKQVLSWHIYIEYIFPWSFQLPGDT